MRLLHTSDWHLGHQLHGIPRDREHAAFLAWLVDTCVAEAVDAVLITGDVFDGSNPPATAQAAYYHFLADLAARLPGVQVVVIGGNHDSPARLEAPAPLLERLDVRVIGAAPADWSRAAIPLARRADARIAAWVAAVPFLRVGDLAATRVDDPAAAVRAVYARAIAAARARCEPGQALIVTGHLHVSGAEPSWLSERRILVGGAEAIAGDLFPADAAYVALGHLHKAQRIGGHDHVRYAGAPVPLAMNEADYRQQVVLVDLDGGGIRGIDVPRAVELLRVPRRGAAPLDEVLALCAALDDAGDEPYELRPFLEVHVRLTRPAPQLRAQLEAALEGKRPRLVQIRVDRAGDGAALGDTAPGVALADLAPRDVLLRRWRRDHEGDPPAALLDAFDALVAEVQP